MIKAIETRYKGYRFRSRLEARWAVFFEAAGWKWKYEHQGYEIGWETPRNWLPDFEIEVTHRYGTTNKFYVEVKGDKDFFKDGEFANALDFGGGPPGFNDSYHDVGTNSRAFCEGDVKPIMLLGDLPHKQWGRLFIPVLTHEKGVQLVWCLAEHDEVIFRNSNLLWTSFQDESQVQYDVQSGFADFQPKIIPTRLADKRTMDALDAARSARFEHGETPMVART